MSSIVVHLCYMYCYAHKMILSIDSFLMLVVHAFLRLYEADLH